MPIDVTYQLHNWIKVSLFDIYYQLYHEVNKVMVLYQLGDIGE